MNKNSFLLLFLTIISASCSTLIKSDDLDATISKAFNMVEEAEKEETKLTIKEKIAAYEAQGVCTMGVTEEWPKNFRSAYEEKPEFKEFSHKKDIKVAILDTGIDYRNYFLKKSIPEKYTMEELNFTNSVPFDTNGHGTHVAGIVLAVMPQAKILPIKVVDGIEGRESEIVNGLRFAIKENVDIINLSLEGVEYSAPEKKLLKKAAQKGIIIISAAGNGKKNIDKKNIYPASYDLPQIVVGNATARNSVAFFSNYGEKVDFFIRGTNVKSLGLDCNSLFMTGTSQATPAITGIVAHLKATNPDISLEEIKVHLASISKKGFSHTESKYGMLSLSKALNTPFKDKTREVASKN